MKSSIGLYGKVVIIGIVATIMLAFLFGQSGLTSLLPKSEPLYGSETAGSTVAILNAQEKPKFTGDTLSAKMKVNSTYNLENISQFGVQAEFSDGTKATIKVMEIRDQWGRFYDVEGAKTFKPLKAGTYYVTYKAYKMYQNTSIETIAEYPIPAYH